MTQASQQQLTGVVDSRQQHDERLIFSLNVGEGTVYKCFDATGAMGLFEVLTGQVITVYGQWSSGVKDYFEVERVEKVSLSQRQDIPPPGHA